MRAVPFRNIFVMGAPYSGSTLLGRLLNSHSRIACGGELGLLGQAIANRRPCSCGRPVTDCPFWQRLLPALPGRTHREHRPADYERVRRTLDADVLVDLSKSLCWRMVRWPWSPWRNASTGFLYLVRDTRAVIASELRRKQPLGAALDKHFKWAVRFERLAVSHPERTLVVYYEDLCAAPELELRRVCSWIGVAYQPRMLRPQDHEHHFAHSSSSSYTHSWSGEIRLDERWRGELDAGVLAQIERRTQARLIYHDIPATTS
jgi:hypothetical protein